MSKYYFIACCLIIGLSVSACSRTAPEEAIRQAMADMQAGAEARKASQVLESVADSFLGKQYMDKAQLRRFLIGLFLRHKKINVVLTKLDIQLNPQDPLWAKMQGTVLVTGSESTLPSEGRLLSFNGEWQSIDGQWLLVRLQWE